MNLSRPRNAGIVALALMGSFVCRARAQQAKEATRATPSVHKTVTPDTYAALPIGAEVRRVVVGADGGPELKSAEKNRAATVREREKPGEINGGFRPSKSAPQSRTLVYSNTLGNFVFAPGAGIRVADDLTTVVSRTSFCVGGSKEGAACNERNNCRSGVCEGSPPACVGGSAQGEPCECPGGTCRFTGCNLDRFVFRVSGDARNDPTVLKGSFTVDYALFDACPDASFFPQPIPLTSGSVHRTPLCIGGTRDGQPCTRKLDCSFGVCDDAVFDIVVQVPQLCVGGELDGQPCTIDSDCPSGSSLFPATCGVILPHTVYLALTFDRDDAGVVFGGLPTLGFSTNTFDNPHLKCEASFGNFPDAPHASFDAQIFTRGNCTDSTHSRSFVGYKNSLHSQSPFSPGNGKLFADDIRLPVAECKMVAYDMAMRGPSFGGGAGVVEVKFHEFLDPLDPDNGGLIPGTTRRLAVTGPEVQVLRAEFDPPIDLPAGENPLLPPFFVTFETSSRNHAPIATCKQADLGSTEDKYWLWTGTRPPSVPPAPDDQWKKVRIPNCHSAFDITIYCQGEPPAGACCDPVFTENKSCVGGPLAGRQCAMDTDCRCNPTSSGCFDGTCVGDAACRVSPQMNCSIPDNWVEGLACESVCVGGGAYDQTCTRQADCDRGDCRGPFQHPCGVGACCTPDDTCENLTQRECLSLAQPGDFIFWKRDTFCGEDGQSCPLFACVQPNRGDCLLARDERGCGDPFCCMDVCAIDSWCCDVEWDSICVWESQDLCPLLPLNDECATSSSNRQALHVEANSSTFIGNVRATENQSDPGFSCHSTAPGSQGRGTLWFTFEATHDSARISTCNSLTPADDSLVAVYRAANPSTPQTACATLEEIACSDDEAGCSSGLNADVCVTGLVPGETYYIQLAGKTDAALGVYQLDMESPCPSRQSDRPVEDVPSAPLPDAVTALLALHREEPDDPWMPRSATPPPGSLPRSSPVVRGPYVSVQVNVDESGNNILGDAANEPSIAIDPTDPSNIVIGWRQFDTVASDFRQAGYAYSHDAGKTWTFPGVLEQGVFRSDPVLDAGADGNFFYYSLNGGITYDLFKSTDGGVSWSAPIPTFGGDKGWMVIDQTNGIGRGNIYTTFSPGVFTRSTDGGLTFTQPIPVPSTPGLGMLAVSFDGQLYVVGSGVTGTESGIVFARSLNARDPSIMPVFDFSTSVNLGGGIFAFFGPNPDGLLGQVWVATDRSTGQTRGNVYILASIGHGPFDLLDVMFARSTDGGLTWSDPIRINDDPVGNGALQWFGTMSVAPNGRIDAVWNDTRNTGMGNLSELFYSFSGDGGLTWSANVAVSPAWDSHIGWPGGQRKIGDYYHSVSDNAGVNVAYAATFNGEQDVYFLRIGERDCNQNGTPDSDDIAGGFSADCDFNTVPDECQRDCNANGTLDICDITSGSSNDCDRNQTPDECDPDLDHDGLIDACDADIDGDGVFNAADICDFTPPGLRVKADGSPLSDTNGNCGVDLVDYARLRRCLEASGPDTPIRGSSCLFVFDYNGNDIIDLKDVSYFLNAFTSAK